MGAGTLSFLSMDGADRANGNGAALEVLNFGFRRIRHSRTEGASCRHYPWWQILCSRLLISETPMPFRQFDAATIALLHRVRDDLFLDLSASSVLSAGEKSVGEARITKQLVTAAESGERNPERLKDCALDGVDGI